MPLQKLIFKPGVNREGTTLTNEGSWFETDKVRFRSGFPEKLGGWAAISANRFLGVCRSLWNWITLKNYNLLGVGTNQKFYVENGGRYYDVTPVTYSSTITGISVEAGSYVATITDPTAASYQTGDIVVISGVLAPIGGVPPEVFNQQYMVTYVSGTEYTIRLRAVSPIESPAAYYPATSTQNATGLDVLVEYLLSSGLPIYTVGTGWGVGPWSPYVEVALTNPFTTTLNSSIVKVTYNAHGLVAGSYVTFTSIATDFGALKTYAPPSPQIPVTKDALLKTFAVLASPAPTANEFYISLADANGITVRATSAVTLQGGAVTLNRQNPDPLVEKYNWGDGYTVGGTGVASGLQLRLWSQSNFGESLIINPRGGALYLWEPGENPTPAFDQRAELLVAENLPTRVNEVMVSDATRIVIAFGCTDYVAPISDGVFDPMLIRWSTNEDFLTWTPETTNQAGSYRLSHGSEIITAVQTRQEILVWTDAALYSMQYIGPPYVWSFNILADNISLISPNAVAIANGMVFWMGTDKFYVYSGRVETLPSALRQYVFQDFNKDQGYQVFGCTNEGYSEVWWFYCSANSNMVDKYVVFNYLDQVWYYGSMQRTAWLDSATRQYPQAALGGQYTMLSQNISDTDTSIDVADASSFPNSGYIRIGSEIIYYAANSGAALNGCLRGQLDSTASAHLADAIVTEYASNLVVFHEFGNDDATDLQRARPIESFIQSSDIDLDDGDRYVFVWQMVPDFSFDGSTTPAPNKPEVEVTIRPRQNPGANYGYGATPDVTAVQSYAVQHTYTVQQFTELLNTRVRGRQIALRIGSNTLGTKWQLGAMRINMRPDGRR